MCGVDVEVMGMVDEWITKRKWKRMLWEGGWSQTSERERDCTNKKQTNNNHNL